jgi:POT family proton-dependent oligopeptide transporter
MWERFSYYGMRAVLILFMVDAVQNGGLGLDVPTAGAIYGLYTGAVYLMALPGGWFADRVFGARNAVFYGGFLIAAGQFSLAFASTVPVGFYLGLLGIILGTGLLKPNVSAIVGDLYPEGGSRRDAGFSVFYMGINIIVGDLYPEGGSRRDAGFSVFYMGINIGAWIGPLICGYLGEQIEGTWRYAFLAAGLVMVAGLIQYRVGAGIHGLGEKPQLSPQEQARTTRTLWSALIGVVGIAAILYILQSQGITSFTLQQAAGAVIFIIVGIAVVYFGYQIAFGPWDTVEKKRLVVIFFLFIGAALFWSGFEQAGSSLNLFGADYTDRIIFGWELPATWLQSVNPLFIILMSPVFAWIWTILGTRAPSIPVKFGLGLVLLGIGFLVMAWASVYSAEGTLVSPAWLVVTYFLHTTGELCLSPIGLSATTKLSPKPLVGQMMGIWFMGAALGNVVAGLIAGEMDPTALAADPGRLVSLFSTVAMFVIGSGILFFLFKGPIKKLAEGVE